MTTATEPASLYELIHSQLAALPPLERAPEVRRRIASVQAQLADLDAKIAEAEAVISAHELEHSKMAAAALDKGEPIPPPPPPPRVTAKDLENLRNQVKALEPLLKELQRIHTNGADEESRAFTVYINKIADDLSKASLERHRHLVISLIQILEPYEMSGGRRIEVVQNFFDDIQRGDTPEERAFVALLRELEEKHPGPARRLRMERATRTLTKTKASTDYVRRLFVELSSLPASTPYVPQPYSGDRNILGV